VTDAVSSATAGNLRQRLSQALFWILLFRGLLAITLGLGLLVNPTKTETLLLNFMGVFWLISGVTLYFRTNPAVGRRLSVSIALVGTLTGLIVITRDTIGTWLTHLILFEMLGAVILVTGISHMLWGIRIRGRDPTRQTTYRFLLGLFELVMGAMMLLPAFEPGAHIYWLATCWALVGGVLIVSQALYLRAKSRI
jgi:uncharacterized membrane protein HdeD (DUF308 family)